MTTPVPDYHTPLPDLGHEAIRKPLADAIDELAATVARLNGLVDEVAALRSRLGPLPPLSN